MGGMDF